MDLTQTGWEDVEWSNLAREGNWQTLANMAIKVLVTTVS